MRMLRCFIWQKVLSIISRLYCHSSIANYLTVWSANPGRWRNMTKMQAPRKIRRTTSFKWLRIKTSLWLWQLSENLKKKTKVHPKNLKQTLIPIFRVNLGHQLRNKLSKARTIEMYPQLSLQATKPHHLSKYWMKALKSMDWIKACTRFKTHLSGELLAVRDLSNLNKIWQKRQHLTRMYSQKQDRQSY